MLLLNCNLALRLCGRGNLGRASDLVGSSWCFFTEEIANKASPVASARLLFLDINFFSASSLAKSAEPPTTAQHVEEDLGEAIEMIIDGGHYG